MDFDFIVILGCLFFILLIWIYYIIKSRVSKEQKSFLRKIDEFKQQSIQNNIIQRKILAELIYNAILSGSLTP